MITECCIVIVELILGVSTLHTTKFSNKKSFVRVGKTQKKKRGMFNTFGEGREGGDGCIVITAHHT